MRLFIDTEFNGFNGRLISMALVPENDTVPEFYKELVMNDQLHPWVKDNVVPHLFIAPSTFSEFQAALANYLREVGECTIIADWPDDIRYFCESLITGPGMMVSLKEKITFELDLGIKYSSLVPHNALFDARAIRDTYMGRTN